MQVSGAIPSHCCLPDEHELVGCYNMSDSSVKRFRYFGVDSSIIMAILEQAEGAEEGKT